MTKKKVISFRTRGKFKIWLSLVQFAQNFSFFCHFLLLLALKIGIFVTLFDIGRPIFWHFFVLLALSFGIFLQEPSGNTGAYNQVVCPGHHETSARHCASAKQW